MSNPDTALVRYGQRELDLYRPQDLVNRLGQRELGGRGSRARAFRNRDEMPGRSLEEWNFARASRPQRIRRRGGTFNLPSDPLVYPEFTSLDDRKRFIISNIRVLIQALVQHIIVSETFLFTQRIPNYIEEMDERRVPGMEQLPPVIETAVFEADWTDYDCEPDFYDQVQYDPDMGRIDVDPPDVPLMYPRIGGAPHHPGLQLDNRGRDLFTTEHNWQTRRPPSMAEFMDKFEIIFPGDWRTTFIPLRGDLGIGQRGGNVPLTMDGGFIKTYQGNLYPPIHRFAYGELVLRIGEYEEVNVGPNLGDFQRLLPYERLELYVYLGDFNTGNGRERGWAFLGFQLPIENPRMPPYLANPIDRDIGSILYINEVSPRRGDVIIKARAWQDEWYFCKWNFWRSLVKWHRGQRERWTAQPGDMLIHLFVNKNMELSNAPSQNPPSEGEIVFENPDVQVFAKLYQYQCYDHWMYLGRARHTFDTFHNYSTNPNTNRTVTIRYAAESGYNSD